jgi:hypothetical protein
MTQTATKRRRSYNRAGAPGREYFDYLVCDPEGRKIGRLKELFANEHGEPQYIRVRMGFFGLRSILIPVCFVVVDEEQRALTLH